MKGTVIIAVVNNKCAISRGGGSYSKLELVGEAFMSLLAAVILSTQMRTLPLPLTSAGIFY